MQLTDTYPYSNIAHQQLAMLHANIAHQLSNVLLVANAAHRPIAVPLVTIATYP